MAYFLLAVKLCRDLLFFSIFWRIVFGWRRLLEWPEEEEGVWRRRQETGRKPGSDMM
jgi:hypothetical protein